MCFAHGFHVAKAHGKQSVVAETGKRFAQRGLGGDQFIPSSIRRMIKVVIIVQHIFGQSVIAGVVFFRQLVIDAKHVGSSDVTALTFVKQIFVNGFACGGNTGNIGEGNCFSIIPDKVAQDTIFGRRNGKAIVCILVNFIRIVRNRYLDLKRIARQPVRNLRVQSIHNSVAQFNCNIVTGGFIDGQSHMIRFIRTVIVRIFRIHGNRIGADGISRHAHQAAGPQQQGTEQHRGCFSCCVFHFTYLSLV